MKIATLIRLASFSLKNLIPLIAPIGETRGTDLAFSSSDENEKGELTRI